MDWETYAAGVRSEFSDAIGDLGVALVVFKADWCGPCRLLAPTLDRVEKDVRDRAHVIRIDIDQNGDLGAAFGVRATPSILLFKDGRLLGRLTRTRTQAGLRDAIDAAVAGELSPGDRLLDGDGVFRRGRSLN